MNPLFQVIPYWFEGSSDCTDEDVLWVEADSLEQLRECLRGTGARIFPLPDNFWVDDSCIDYALPRDRHELFVRMSP